jgi:hypothetical protein
VPTPALLDDLIRRLATVQPTKRAQRLYDDAMNSGIFIDHAKALYGTDPADHFSVEFGRNASSSDIDALRALIYQNSQRRLAQGPEVLQIYRGDRWHRQPEDVLSFSQQQRVANHFAAPIGKMGPGTVTPYTIPRQSVLADSRLATGTFDEAEILARLLDTTPAQPVPWKPPLYK